MRNMRFVIAKPVLDVHDRGTKVIARELRDAGMEVIYTGIRQTPEMIAQAAMQEDVDVIGLSILSGAHIELFPQIITELNNREMGDTLIVAGGIIPESDHNYLTDIGIKGIFGPGTSTSDIVTFIRESIK